jgi:Ca2+-dependent lipid-binding protein
MGKLTVFLDKITNLRDEDTLGKSDPYVQFYLEQDNFLFDKGYGKQTSSKKKNELNPVYGETFTFDDVPSLNNMVLHVKVLDDDMGPDDKLGSCHIKLENLKMPAETETVIDNKKGKGWFSRKAKIFLKISYVG